MIERKNAIASEWHMHFTYTQKTANLNQRTRSTGNSTYCFLTYFVHAPCTHNTHATLTTVILGSSFHTQCFSSAVHKCNNTYMDHKHFIRFLQNFPSIFKAHFCYKLLEKLPMTVFDMKTCFDRNRAWVFYHIAAATTKYRLTKLRDAAPIRTAWELNKIFHCETNMTCQKQQNQTKSIFHVKRIRKN